VRTVDGSGFGTADLKGATIAVSGLGATDPRVPNGETGSAASRVEVRAWVGGLPAAATATMSATRVGEWDVTLAPSSASVNNGDVITVTANGRAANRTIWKPLTAPQVRFVPLPEGTPELRNIQSSDLRASLITANAARSDAGCYRTWVFDMNLQSSSLLDDCLTAANRQAVSPVMTAPETPSFAALVGPPTGEAPNPVSNKVRMYSAVKGEVLEVELPAAATNLVTNGNGNYVAVIPGSQVEIDSETGETRPFAVGAGGAGGGAPGGGTGALNPATLAVDLGNGLQVVMNVPLPVAQNQFAVVVTDDEDAPKKAKLAILDQQARVTATVDFPEGWVPLVPPEQQLPPNANLPPAQAALLRFRIATYMDAQSRSLLVVARRADDSKHALVAFSLAENSVRAVEFPEGWFAVTCNPRINISTLELSRRIAFFGDKTSVNAILRTPCTAQGFLTVDLNTGRVEATATPGQGQMNAGAQADEMNDFVFATNVDPSRNNRSETIFTMDGVSLTPYRFDPPSSVQAIAQVTRVPEMNLLVATATAGRVQGDAGFVVFDLEKVETRLLPTPSGFASVALLGVFPASRKLIARGIKADGASLLIYDLVSGDLQMPANPAGVTWFGPPIVQPAAPGGGGNPGGGGQQVAPVVALRANGKASAVMAIGYNAERQQTGIILVRIP